MIKILHISNYFYPHTGGIETACKDIIDALGYEKYEHQIICFGNEGNVEFNVPITRVKYKFKISSQPISFKYKKILKKLITTFSPDIIIIHVPNPLVEHYLLKCKYKGKLIVFHHLDIIRQKFLKHFVRLTQKHINEAAHTILTHSNVYIENSQELKNFKNKCVAIPFCFKENEFKLSEEENEKIIEIKNKYKDKTILFYSGRYSKTKALDLAIKGCATLDDVVFLIGSIGEVPRNYKARLEIKDNIIYVGNLSRRDYVIYLNACDVFVLPSIYKNESFSITLVEAIGVGKPTITFTVEGSGISYIAPNDVTGIECENQNIYAVKVAIASLKEDIELRKHYSDNAKDRAKKLFSEKSFISSINKLIEEVYNNITR